MKVIVIHNRKFVVWGEVSSWETRLGFWRPACSGPVRGGESRESCTSGRHRRLGGRNQEYREECETSSGPVIGHWAEPRGSLSTTSDDSDPAIGGMTASRRGRWCCVDGARDGTCGASGTSGARSLGPRLTAGPAVIGTSVSGKLKLRISWSLRDDQSF